MNNPKPRQKNPVLDVLIWNIKFHLNGISSQSETIYTVFMILFRLTIYSHTLAEIIVISRSYCWLYDFTSLNHPPTGADYPKCTTICWHPPPRLEFPWPNDRLSTTQQSGRKNISCTHNNYQLLAILYSSDRNPRSDPVVQSSKNPPPHNTADFQNVFFSSRTHVTQWQGYRRYGETSHHIRPRYQNFISSHTHWLPTRLDRTHCPHDWTNDTRKRTTFSRYGHTPPQPN